MSKLLFQDEKGGWFVVQAACEVDREQAQKDQTRDTEGKESQCSSQNNTRNITS